MRENLSVLFPRCALAFEWHMKVTLTPQNPFSEHIFLEFLFLSELFWSQWPVIFSHLGACNPLTFSSVHETRPADSDCLFSGWFEWLLVTKGTRINLFSCRAFTIYKRNNGNINIVGEFETKEHVGNMKQRLMLKEFRQN